MADSSVTPINLVSFNENQRTDHTFYGLLLILSPFALSLEWTKAKGANWSCYLGHDLIEQIIEQSFDL